VFVVAVLCFEIFVSKDPKPRCNKTEKKGRRGKVGAGYIFGLFIRRKTG
jgi:hypothetical protein